MNKLCLYKNVERLKERKPLSRLLVVALIVMGFIAPNLLEAQTAFTPGNLVVEQVGNGSTALSSSASAINFLEFTTSSSQTNPVQTVSAPASTIVESGTSSSDGHLTLSADGTSLVFVAYGASVGTATITSNTSGSVVREVGFVGHSGSSSIAAIFANAAGNTGAFKNSNIRSAYYDGTYIWASGDDGSGNNTSSVHATTITNGTTVSSTANNIAINSNSPSTSSNGVYVYKDQLYITANSSNGIYSVGTGKPTTTSTTAASVVTGLTGNPYDAVFLNTGNTNPGHPDLIYATDGSHIYKYYYNGSSWVAAGSYTPNAYGLVAHVTSAGNVSLYFVVNQGTSANSIEKIVDATGRTGSISGGGSPTTIATAGSNYVFDGISWAPSQTSTIAASNYASTIANGSQNISGGNYGDIIIPSGSTATLTGNIYINGTFTVQSGGTLICGNHFIFSPEGSYGTFNVQSGGTLEMGDDSGIYNYSSGGNIQTATRFYNPGANYVYNGSVAQVTGDGLPASLTNSNLTISNPAGVTLSQSTTTTGTGSTTISSGALLIVSATNTLGGALTDNGTIEVTATGNANDLTTQYTGTLTLSSGTVLFAGTSAQQIGSETLDNLALNNSLGLTLTGNVTVTGMVTITAGTLSLSSNTLTTSGASAMFNGSGAQTTGSWFPSSITNLSLNNSGGLTLSNPLTVTGTLTLTSGKLALGSNKLTIGTSGSISGASSTSYVYTNGAGVLEMPMTAGHATFPVGDDYNPITITDASTTDIWDVFVTDGITENDGATQVPDYSVNRTWTIKCTNGSPAVTITPQWNNTTDLCTGGHYDLTNAFVVSRDITHTNTWTPSTSSNISGEPDPTQLTVSSGATPISITAGDQYDIGVGLGSLSPLPVSLLNFNATAEDTKVALVWSTASEQNNSYFDIERSLNTENWSAIGNVEGHGTSQAENKYSFTDPLTGVVLTGAIYYRLKQVDFNGKFAYSNISAVQLNGTQNGIYPNPATSAMTLTLASDVQGNATVNLVDMNGKLIQSSIQLLMPGNNSLKVDLSNVPYGNYLVKVVTSSSVQCYRLMRVN